MANSVLILLLCGGKAGKDERVHLNKERRTRKDLKAMKKQ